MRNISFALTTPQFLDGTKDVTRRLGWVDLVAGSELCAVEKGQGLGKGGKIRRLGIILVLDVRFEPLRLMLDDPAYGRVECGREGFPHMSPCDFVAFFCQSHRDCTPQRAVTRIVFKKAPT